LCSLSTYCQSETKTAGIIEGSKVLLEFTRFFAGRNKDKKDAKMDLLCQTKMATDVVFKNKKLIS